MANNYGAFAAAVPPFLNVVDFAHRLVGPKPLEYISGAMNRVSNHMVPTWNPYMPRVSPRTQIRRRLCGGPGSTVRIKQTCASCPSAHSTLWNYTPLRGECNA